MAGLYSPKRVNDPRRVLHLGFQHTSQAQMQIMTDGKPIKCGHRARGVIGQAQRMHGHAACAGSFIKIAHDHGRHCAQFCPRGCNGLNMQKNPVWSIWINR